MNDTVPGWAEIPGRVDVRFKVFAERVRAAMGGAPQPALAGGHDWGRPIHDLPSHALPERRHAARRLLKRFEDAYRKGKGTIADAALERELATLAERITHVLGKPLPLPRADEFARLSARAKAHNIGLEIEVEKISLEARAGKDGQIIKPFYPKCVLDESPSGFEGFSVQSDGGHVELVSDPPDVGRSPRHTAAAMARHVEALQKSLLSRRLRRRGTGRWMQAVAVARGRDGTRPRLHLDGTALDVRLATFDVNGKAPPLQGEFHVTVGIHLSALPWLFACGSAAGGGQDGFPLPGQVFRRAPDRQVVLGQIERLRRIARRRRWELSPEFEGLAYLMFAYLVSARTAPVGRVAPVVLSPKQLFPVLARTDFATMLGHTREARWSSRRRAALGREMIALAGESDTAMFDDRFGQTTPVQNDPLDDGAGVAGEAGDAGPETIALTRGDWLGGLFSDPPIDRLTTAHHRTTAARKPDPRLFRGMGSLGEQVDRLASEEFAPFLPAPIIELRGITPTGSWRSGDWESRTADIVDLVTALNAPVSHAQRRSAAEELKWIRRSGTPRHGRLAGSRSDRAREHIDEICADIRAQFGRATTRAGLWTLLDRARSAIKPDPDLDS